MPIQKFKTLGFRNNNTQDPGMKKDPVDEMAVTKPEQELQAIVGKLNERKSNVPFNLKFIPRNRIIFNEKNDYAQVDIEKLAEGILHFGLIHSLEGFYDEEQDKYVIESGERRTRAIDILLEKFADYEDKDSQEYRDYLDNVKGYEAGYPINVKKRKFAEVGDMSKLDEIDSEIRLMDANEEVRPSDPQDKYKRVKRRAELIEERNTLLPYRERVNVNKEVGSKLGMSERQVQKYKNLDNLIPELKDEFFKNSITLTDGANYSVLTEEEQRNILKLIQEGKKVSADDVKKLKEEKDLVQTELFLKEKELSSLKEESDKLREEHKNELERLQQSIEEDRERIKKEISEEVLNNSPDKKKVEELEIKLKEKETEQKNIDDDLKEINQELNDKNNEIEMLEAELNHLKNRPIQDIEKIRIEVKLSSTIERALRIINDLKKDYRAYSKVGNPDKTYQNEIGKIAKDLSSITK